MRPRAIALLLIAALAASILAAAPAPAARQRQHWIGVRSQGGERVLFDRRTGDRFVPRGANLIAKVPEGDHVASGLFRPRDWDPAGIRRELRRMDALGYTTVRVFLDLCNVDCISTAGGSIRPAYARNVADFLRMARERGLVVMLASNDLPDRGYASRLPCCSPFGGYRNSLWLAPEGHDLLVEYWTEVIEALREQDAPLEVAIYEIQQEQFVLADVEPLSLTEGLVTTADGETYDLSHPTQKTAMIESNVRLGVERVRDAIRDVDPGALVTMGFFGQIPGDVRLIPSRAMLESSALDFADLHLYPVVGTLEGQVQAIGLSEAVETPVVMGEFGAFRFGYANARTGAWALAHWQADSCAYGFDGWLVWLWAERDDEVFGARQGGDAIAELLSPDDRPDPCRATGVPTNVAPDATATASAALPSNPAADAIDGLAETSWSAGADAPQWIELDLGAARRVVEIHLVVAQFPEGATHHRLLLAGDDGVFEVVGEFERDTAEGDVLRFVPPEPVEARYIRIDTVSSPSWVAWSEIQVYA